jgi:hypothetical protein
MRLESSTSTPVNVGPYSGYPRREDEIAKGVRRYIVMWDVGPDWFTVISGPDDVDVAVNAARSTVCP